MARREELRQTKVTILACDLCGSEENMARYEVNRRCQNCGREVCNKCTSDDEFGTTCKVCARLIGEWQPKISAAYKEYERLQQAFKEASLAAKP
jgi:hypothetical protein